MMFLVEMIGYLAGYGVNIGAHGALVVLYTVETFACVTCVIRIDMSLNDINNVNVEYEMDDIGQEVEIR